MLDNKLKLTFSALLGAMALSMSAPAFAQDAAAPAAPAAEAPAAAPAAAPEAAPVSEAPPTMKNAGKLNVGTMFMDSDPVVKVIMIGLALASILSWTILVTKILEFRALNRVSDTFVEGFRGAKSINDMNRIALSEEFDGNPLADMAAAAAQEIELSRQAGLAITGEHRDTTIDRAQHAVSAVQ
ncbi:MAG: flagellar motor protein MotA, partial [Dehalococcoidia bacterium]|nr:flagellar motor protein MotA [Dehalococcoidia bacterium]